MNVLKEMIDIRYDRIVCVTLSREDFFYIINDICLNYLIFFFLNLF